ncbi:MAG: acyltransferase [Chitinophagaceae bacterium]
MNQSSSTFADSKRHYNILDGLRGVAAMTVVVFHILETFTGGDHTKQVINHGYMAVDFFFLLSGFVVGYAYDDRWGKMTVGNFFKRRLIRLHPMIIAGMLIGAVTFYFQACSYWPQIENVPVGKLLLVMLIGFTLLPVTSSLDIRGWQEMHPLNGPAWTLFFEYIANILYALFIRKFSNLLLFLLVLIAGAALIHLAVTSATGDLIGGWSLEPAQFRIGLTRLLYPFFAGLLMRRVVKLTYINHAFLWCSLLLVAVLAMPRIGGNEQLWMNGLYDSLCVVVVFPVIVYLGASGEIKEGFAAKLCKFFGDISYPLYIIHYPFIYLFMAWIDNNKATLTTTDIVMMAAGVFVVTVGLAYGCLKLYDEPVRKWLTRQFIAAK